MADTLDRLRRVIEPIIKSSTFAYIKPNGHRLRDDRRVFQVISQICAPHLTSSHL